MNLVFWHVSTQPDIKPSNCQHCHRNWRKYHQRRLIWNGSVRFYDMSGNCKLYKRCCGYEYQSKVLLGLRIKNILWVSTNFVSIFGNYMFVVLYMFSYWNTTSIFMYGALSKNHFDWKKEISLKIHQMLHITLLAFVSDLTDEYTS